MSLSQIKSNLDRSNNNDRSLLSKKLMQVSSSSENAKEPCVLLAQYIFIQIDPLLRLLLTLLQQHNAYIKQESEETASHNKSVGSHDYNVNNQSDLLQIWRTIERVLIQLPPKIASARLQGSDNDIDRDDQTAATALAILSDYWFLPFFALLKFEVGINQFEKKIQSEHLRLSDDALRIRQSAWWRLQATAVETLTTLMTITRNETCMPAAKLQQCVFLCVMALPPGKQLMSQHHKSNSKNTTSVNSNSERESNTSNRYTGGMIMEDGYNCWIKLWKALDLLVTCKCDGDLCKLLTTSYDGVLVARVVDSAVTTLLLPISTSHSLQLQALQTLKTWLTCINRLDSWQSVFPGTFVGLFKPALRQARSGSRLNANRQVLTSTLETLNLFLQITLRPLHEKLKKDDAAKGGCFNNNAGNVAAQLLNLSQNFNNRFGKTEKTGCHQRIATSAVVLETKQKDFLTQVRSRVNTPLRLLLQLLVNSPHAQVKFALLCMCQTLVIDTSFIWTQKAAKTEDNNDQIEVVSNQNIDNDIDDTDIYIIAAEVILSLTKDDDSELQRKALSLSKTVLEQFGLTFSVSRLVDLWQETVVLAYGDKQQELRQKLQLITSYLDSLCELDEKALKDVRVTLNVPKISHDIQQTCIKLFDVDFATVPAHVDTRIMDLNELQREPERPSFIHSNSETEAYAIQMVKSLALLLGSKHTARWIDAILYQFYQDSVARADNPTLFTSSSQIMWLHERIGAITMAKYLLLGCFDSSKQKVTKKSVHHFESLLFAIIPTLISDVLWDLPTNKSLLNVNDDDDFKAVGISSSPSIVSFNLMAVRGNAILSYDLHFLLVSCIELAVFNKQELLFLVLHKVLQKSSTPGLTFVRDIAKFSLYKLALTCSYKNVSEMIRDSSELLLEEMITNFRITGGGSTYVYGSSGWSDFLKVIAVSISLLKAFGDKEFAKSDDIRSGNVGWTYFDRLMELVLEKFDHMLDEIKDDEEKALVMAQLYSELLKSVSLCYTGSDITNVKAYVSQVNVWSWEKDLEAFSIPEISAKEGSKSAEKISKDEKPTNDRKCSSKFEQETDLVARLLFRSSHLLNHESLKVQVEAFKAISHAFYFLNWVGQTQSLSEEVNGTRTAILRQIAEIWYALAARMKTLVREVIYTTDNRNILLIVPLQQTPVKDVNNVAEKKVFLATLFGVIATITELSDDFMASRLRDQVLPVISNILDHYVRQRRVRQRIGNAVVYHSTPMPDSDQVLVKSIFDLLKRLYSHQPVALSLSGFITKIGSLILLLMDMIDEFLEVLSVEALKSMLRVDCDALWRQLMQYAGRTLPICPLLSTVNKSNTTSNSAAVTVVPNRLTYSDKLTLRATELIEFVESLPEQMID